MFSRKSLELAIDYSLGACLTAAITARSPPFKLRLTGTKDFFSLARTSIRRCAVHAFEDRDSDPRSRNISSTYRSHDQLTTLEVNLIFADTAFENANG